MKVDPNKILLIPLTSYEIIVAVNQLRSSVPEAGNQTTVVNIIEKLRKALSGDVSVKT